MRIWGGKTMKAKPLDKRLLIHKIKWIKKRLATDTSEGVVIDKVRLAWKRYYTPLAQGQQTIEGNWILYWSPEYSGKDPATNEMPAWSIGDTIEFISAPLFPKVCTITSIIPCPDINPEQTHHWELTLV